MKSIHCTRRLDVPGQVIYGAPKYEAAPVAHVTLFGNLRNFTGGVGTLEVEAHNVRQLFRVLAAKFPDLAPHLEDGLAVAIDGQIYQDALLEQILPDSDVHILPQIAGG